MSFSHKRPFDPLQLPHGWLKCPRKADSLIVDKFLAFKVPLSQKFNKNVPLECRFHMSMVIDSAKKNFGTKLGLIINLTNSDRYYDPEEVKSLGIKYCKISCKGHGESPKEVKDAFTNLVEEFVRKNPTELIGVHCTHGFNRTGFLICCYMIEKLDYSVDMAVALFAQSRPPGIYKQDYLDDLVALYVNDDERNYIQIPTAPPVPSWKEENESTSSHLNDEEDSEGSEIDSLANNNSAKDTLNDLKRPSKRPKIRRTQEDSNINAKFADPKLRGIETCTDPNEIDRVRSETQKMCNWTGKGFPGAQPVSMDQQNVQFLKKDRYQVSWKADGTRYLMYINGQNKTYLLDRDNSVFIAKDFSFPHRKNNSVPLNSTLLDGEFVIDVDNSKNPPQEFPRFLIYDIVKFENDKVGDLNFEIRMLCIQKEIIDTRKFAMEQGRINRQVEPFSIRKKQFFPLGDTKKLLSEEFTKQLTHGIDGLIYQPVDEPYKAGRCDTMLKWKPPSMNSVDFKLKIGFNQQYGMLAEKIGYLYVTGYDEPFSTIRVTKSIANLHDKIIECRWFNNQWDFMRERLDKSYPNHVSTAKAVCESIRDPITEEKLLEVIQFAEKNEKKQMLPPVPTSMPPPPMPPPAH